MVTVGHVHVIILYRNDRSCLTTFPNTEKRVENTTRSGVFLTNFEVFDFFYYSMESKAKEKTKKLDRCNSRLN